MQDLFAKGLGGDGVSPASVWYGNRAGLPISEAKNSGQGTEVRDRVVPAQGTGSVGMERWLRLRGHMRLSRKWN